MKRKDNNFQGKSVGSGLSFTINLGGGYVKVESTIFVSSNATDAEIDEALKTQERLFWKQFEKQLEVVKKVKKRLTNES